MSASTPCRGGRSPDMRLAVKIDPQLLPCLDILELACNIRLPTSLPAACQQRRR
jgi:hypothetical protein